MDAELLRRTAEAGREVIEQLRMDVEINGKLLHLYNAGFKEGEKRFGLFARDLFLSGFIMDDPDFLRRVVEFACLTQGREEDPRTGEEPGKVIHEYEHVELRGRETRYNASDTTQLALVALGRLLEEGHEDFVSSKVPCIRRGLDYLYEHIENDIFWEDPTYCGADRFALRSTYWKDDRLPNRDHPDYPVAYSLVQALTVAAFRAAADMANSLDFDPSGSELTETADRLVEALFTVLWDEETRSPAIARDERGPITGVSSDALHLLAYLEPEDVPREKLDRIVAAAELLETPYGFRTYAPEQTDYSPDSYHLGSVWPFEQYFIARAGRKFGRDSLIKEAGKALRALDEHGFYELFGWDGEEIEPLGCDRQLWSACLPIGLQRLID